MFLELFLVTLFLIYGLLKIITWRMEKVTENIPEQKSYPIIGHAYMMLKCRNMSDLWKFSYGMLEKTTDTGIMKFWFGPVLAILISDPKYIEVVSSSPYATNKSSFYSKMFGDVFHGAVITESGQRWKELRKPLTSSFTKKIFSTDYHFVFVRRTAALAQHIRDNMLGVEFDVSHLLSRLFFDIFSETHVGIDTNEVVEQKFNLFKNANTFFSTRLLTLFRYHLYFLKLGDYFKESEGPVRKIKKEMNEFYQWILEEKGKSKKKCKDGVEYYLDFLLRRKEEKKLTHDVIQKELLDVVVAASGTSAIIAASALVFLAMFPDIQEEVYQEQLSIFGNSKRDATEEDVSSMVYLTMVIKETLRITGVPGIIRKASEDIKLDEYIIPKGAYIYIWLQKAHRNPKQWETPNQFNPKHFLPERESARSSFAFIPFGVSPRICAGFQYGLTSVTILLSTLLRNFEVKTTLKYEELVYDYNILLEITGGNRVQFIDRNKC